VPTDAAGGLLWRYSDTGRKVRIALVHRPRYDDWSLPKGKLHVGEEYPACAARETAEETGCQVAVQQRLTTLCYRVGSGTKEVTYWSMRSLGGHFAATREVDRLRWAGPKKALRLLSYAGDRYLVEEFLDAPLPDSVVVLARHASAGKRSEWKAADDERPLDQIGWRDATAAANLALLCAPRAVYSVPLLRCRQTAVPIGDALGLDILDAPELSDDGYAERPAAAVETLLALAAKHESVYVCSQGDSIPGMLRDLGVGSDVETRKGAFWVLGLREGRVLFADYYRRAGR
jgi:8-oxo-(d)GTP phosphatase